MGAGKLEESAKKSAAVFNQIHPYYMILTNVSILPGTTLYKQMKRGEFTEASEKERLEEIRTLIANMDNPITIDTATAASSIYFVAELPKDKKRILMELDRAIESFSDEQEKILHARRVNMRSV